jgi:hypothetical protein
MKVVILSLSILSIFILSGCFMSTDAALEPAGQKELVVAGEKVELKRVDLIANKLELGIPSVFQKMSADMLQKKYPSTKPPQVAYANEGATAIIAFSTTPSAIQDEQIPAAKDSLKNAVRATVNKWCDDGVAKINGRNIAYIDFLSEVSNGIIFTHLMLLEADNRLIVISFNCLEQDKQVWQPIAAAIMHSIKVR